MPGRVLCLGDPLVDLVSDRALEDADAFVPRVGGGAATVALSAAREGAAVALAGGVGSDAWGSWLATRLARGGADLALLIPVPGATSAVAFLGAGGTYTEVGERPGGLGLLRDRVGDAAAAARAVLVATDALASGEDRAAVMGAREVALDAGVPIVLDVDLRRGRWRSAADAGASANACVPGSLLVCVGARDAETMTGERDPERTALAFVKAGARLVVLALEDEVLLRGELRAAAPPLAAPGDLGALTGSLLARLAGSDFYPPVVAASLPEAVAAASSRALA